MHYTATRLSNIYLRGNNIAGSIVRLGANHEEFDYSGAGEGLEIIGRAPASGERNHIELYSQEDSPSLQLTCNKTPNTPWIRLKNSNDEEKVSIDGYGLHMKKNSFSYTISPGTDYNGALERGLREYALTLSNNPLTVRPWLCEKLYFNSA